MRRFWLLLIAALVAMPACARGVEGLPGQARRSEQRSPAEAAQPAPQGGSTVSTTTGSCVETYSLQTLRNRQVAFDGVVKQVQRYLGNVPPGEGQELQQDRVLFQVNRWYRGGSGDTTTLKSSVPLEAIVSDSLDTPSLKIGGRYLVSGDGGFIWSCGFTRAYSAGEASRWEAALGP